MYFIKVGTLVIQSLIWNEIACSPILVILEYACASSCDEFDLNRDRNKKWVIWEAVGGSWVTWRLFDSHARDVNRQIIDLRRLEK